LKPGVSWIAVSPSVIRYLWATGAAYNERDQKEGFSEFSFDLGEQHPAYEAIRDHLPNRGHPYAWYIRVPDVPAFLRHVKPVLGRHLAQSAGAGHPGELKLSFYRSGVRLAFEQGCITAVEPWKPTAEEGGNAA